MSTFVWCELVCRDCTITDVGEYTAGTVPRASLKKQAKALGWTFEGKEAYCKKCTKERAAQAQKEPKS